MDWPREAANVQTELRRRDTKSRLIFMVQLGHCFGKGNRIHQRKIMGKEPQIYHLLIMDTIFHHTDSTTPLTGQKQLQLQSTDAKTVSYILYIQCFIVLTKRGILDLYSPVCQQQSGKRSRRYCLALSDPCWATLCVCVCVSVFCCKQKENRKRDQRTSLQRHWRCPNFTAGVGEVGETYTTNMTASIT